jgi:hypothetical protein
MSLSSEATLNRRAVHLSEILAPVYHTACIYFPHDCNVSHIYMYTYLSHVIKSYEYK